MGMGELRSVVPLHDHHYPTSLLGFHIKAGDFYDGFSAIESLFDTIAKINDDILLGASNPSGVRKIL